MKDTSLLSPSSSSASSSSSCSSFSSSKYLVPSVFPPQGTPKIGIFKFLGLLAFKTTILGLKHDKIHLGPTLDVTTCVGDVATLL